MTAQLPGVRRLENLSQPDPLLLILLMTFQREGVDPPSLQEVGQESFPADEVEHTQNVKKEEDLVT